jgi:hypothetical protein
MPWVDVFVVFLISHLVGDYMLQTDWQALHKRGGMMSRGVSRRALCSHVLTYTVAFVPGLIWLSSSIGAGAIGVGALIAIPHFVQDDGTLLAAYSRTVKKADLAANPSLSAALDQSFHFLALFLTALLAGQ